MNQESPQHPGESQEQRQWVAPVGNELEDEDEVEVMDAPGIGELPEQLGYVENGELARLRAGWVEAMRQGSQAVHEYAVAYQEQAEAAEAEHHADQPESFDGAKFQIGLLLAKAAVCRDGGRTDDYWEALIDARDYANNMGLDEVVDVIDRELNSLSL